MGVKGARIPLYFEGLIVAILAKECHIVNTLKYFRMNINKLTLSSTAYPAPLKTIAAPPATLYYAGANLASLLQRPRVAIVGSRRVTAYGKQVTMRLARDLAEQGIQSSTNHAGNQRQGTQSRR